MVLKILLNLYYVFSFFLKKKCKVIYFTIPAEELSSQLETNVILALSLRIDNAYKFSKTKYYDTKITFDGISGLSENEETELKKIVKMGWLIRNISATGINNPIQLLNYGNSYICHPGTDRILVASLLAPKKHIQGLYLWYNDLEKYPIFLNYDWKEITNPFVFLSIFTYSKNFRFKMVQINEYLDISDQYNIYKSNAMFSLAKKAFKKSNKMYDYLFLSFHDNVQWKHIYNKLSLKDVITFTTDNTCVFSGINFKKINGIWLSI